MKNIRITFVLVSTAMPHTINLNENAARSLILRCLPGIIIPCLGMTVNPAFNFFNLWVPGKIVVISDLIEGHAGDCMITH